MTLRVLAFPAALALTACHEVVSFALPESPPNANAAIIFYEDGGGGGEAYAFTPGAPPGYFAGEVSAIDVLYYEATLDALGLQAGKLERAPEPNRPLPRSSDMRRAQSETFADFSFTRERSDALADARIAALDVEGCFLRGGCYDSPEAAAQDDCVLPCPFDQPRPEPVQPPKFEDCPPGWRKTDIERYEVCEPPARLVDCPLGQVQPIDETRCVPIGTPCEGADDWNIDLATRPGRIHYVRDGAAGGGIGTRGAPFATFAEAAAIAQPGELIALSKGRFSGPIEVPAGVELIGACAAETVLDGQRGTALQARGDGAKISTLRIENSMLAVELAGAVLLEDVILLGTLGEGAGAIGVDIASGEVSIESILVRGFENAIRSRSQAPVSISRAVLFDSGDAAINASGRGDLSISDTISIRARRRAVNISAPNPSTRVNLERVYFSGHQEQTINIGTATTRIRDAVVRDTGEVGPFGTGIYFAFGSLELSRVVLERHTQAALWVFDSTTLVEDVVVAAIKGHALELQDSESTLKRVGIFEPYNAILIVGSGSATATDLGIEMPRTHPVFLPFYTGAVIVDPGMKFTAERMSMKNAPEASISVGLGGTLELRDAVLSGSQSGVDIFSASAIIENSILSDIQKTCVGVYRDSIGGLADPELRLDGFLVENCGDAGLDLSSGGIRVIKNGVLSRNTLGARLDFDPKIGFENVKVLNNRSAFEILPP